MRLFAIAMGLVLATVGGCVEGGVDTLAYQKSPDGTVVLRFKNTKDNTIDAMDVDLEKGTISLHGLKSNASSLGQIQSDTIKAQSVVLQAIVDRVISALPLLGGVTGGGLGSVVGSLPATQPAVLSPVKQQALADLAACPVYDTATKAWLAKLIQSPVSTDAEVSAFSAVLKGQTPK